MPTFAKVVKAVKRAAKRRGIKVKMLSPGQCPWCEKKPDKDIDAAKKMLKLAGAKLSPPTGTAEAVARMTAAAASVPPRKLSHFHTAKVESESWVNPAAVSDAALIAEVQRRNLVIPDPARGGA